MAKYKTTILPAQPGTILTILQVNFPQDGGRLPSDEQAVTATEYVVIAWQARTYKEGTFASPVCFPAIEVEEFQNDYVIKFPDGRLVAITDEVQIQITDLDAFITEAELTAREVIAENACGHDAVGVLAHQFAEVWAGEFPIDTPLHVGRIMFHYMNTYRDSRSALKHGLGVPDELITQISAIGGETGQVNFLREFVQQVLKNRGATLPGAAPAS